MIDPVKISFAFVVLVFVILGAFDLATPFLTVLFSFFALTKLRFRQRTWVAIALFLLLAALVLFAMVFFLNRVRVALPDIVSKLVPVISDHAHTFGIELGFKDWDDVKEEFSDHFDIKNIVPLYEEAYNQALNSSSSHNQP